MRYKQTLIIIIFVFVHASFAIAQQVVLAKRLIDGTGKVIENPVVVIQGGKIIKVTTRDKVSKTDTIVDLGECTLLPGLIDLHVHPNLVPDNYQVDHLKTSSAAKALRGLKNVQDLLQAGWTTLRIAGDADVGYANMDVKKAINSGMFVGPRLFGAAHYISVTGGGGDINQLSYEQPVLADGLIANGADEMRKAVRTEIKYGSDWIKILVSGAFMASGNNPNNVHVTEEELQAAVDEAAKRDVPVMAHAHSTAGIKMAIKCGVKTIEHASFLDEEAMNMMIGKNIYLIPTLAVHLFFNEKMKDNVSMKKTVEMAHKADAGKYEQLKLAVKKGVKFGLGTDNIGWPAEYSAKEFVEYQKIGMTPMQAIMCATIINAQILNKQNEIGSIEEGKWADMIAVKGDPLKDLTELQQVKFVMIGGKIVKKLMN